jgi:hypothetical protein
LLCLWTLNDSQLYDSGQTQAIFIFPEMALSAQISSSHSGYERLGWSLAQASPCREIGWGAHSAARLAPGGHGGQGTARPTFRSVGRTLGEPRGEPGSVQKQICVARRFQKKFGFDTFSAQLYVVERKKNYA